MKLPRFTLYLLIVLLIAASFWLLKPQPSDDVARAPMILTPWDISVHENATSSVLGLQLETDTLATAIRQLGNDFEIAIISNSRDSSALEVYFSHFAAGPIQAKLILGIGATREQLERMQTNAQNVAITSSGSRKYRLDSEGLALAMQLKIISLTLIPAAQLNPDILRDRFGSPADTVVINENESHWLYPDRGLDISLHKRGKEVLQYVAPGSFERIAAPLHSAESQASE